MNPTDRVLKVDVAGRVWTPRELREAVLDEFERSGMPATEFAAHVGVKYPTFASWVQKRRRGGGAKARRKPGALKWVEATVDEAKAGAARALIVHLPGGVHAEVGDASQAVLAAELLRAFCGGGVAC
jgi:hypothetical protein